jgi:hypothetical protein
VADTKKEIEILEAMLKRGECPFDGKHFSSMSRAVCPVCTPPREQAASEAKE